MRKPLPLVLASASVGSVLTALVLEPRAAAVGGQGGGVVRCSARNGDVNADGNVDVSDAVTILGNLFLGDPPQLLPLCLPPPDTGQKSCYDLSGAEIPCDGETCPGQDGAYATGCPGEGRFVDNGDGTVTDNCTGLMWQEDVADVTGDGRSDLSDQLRWCEALDYCEKLAFAGHDDWRLPNVRELESIVDHERDAGIDPELRGQRTTCWSSTTVRQKPNCAWIVFFGSPVVFVCDKGGVYFIRAVRAP